MKEKSRFKFVSILASTLPLNSVAKDILQQKNINLKVSIYDNANYGKPIIVFLHGIGLCKETFIETHIIDAFEENHRVIAIDLPGHGQSTMIDMLPHLNEIDRLILASELYSMPGLIAQIAAALKVLQVKDSCIMGWSIGGHIAHGLAIKYPELISSLITCGTPAINYAEPNKFKEGFSEWFVDNIIQDWLKNPVRYLRYDLQGEQSSRVFGAESIILSMGYTNVVENGSDNYAVKSLMTADPLFRKYLYLTLEKHVDKPELYGRKFLEENTCIPVCFIEGEDDGGCMYKKLKEYYVNHIMGKHPYSRFYSFEKTKHAVFRVHPQEFISCMKEFLRQSPEPNHLFSCK